MVSKVNSLPSRFIFTIIPQNRIVRTALVVIGGLVLARFIWKSLYGRVQPPDGPGSSGVFPQMPPTPSQCLALANEAFGKGDAAAALKYLDQALIPEFLGTEADYLKCPLLELRGEVHLCQNNLDLALTDFTDALKHIPYAGIACLVRLHIGHIHALRGQMVEAVEETQRAYELMSWNAEIVKGKDAQELNAFFYFALGLYYKETENPLLLTKSLLNLNKALEYIEKDHLLFDDALTLLGEVKGKIANRR